jgi:hypothetical protein
MSVPDAIAIDGLAIICRPAAQLKPHASNARTHSPKQIGQIVRSMRQYGWTNPILVDENGAVLAGHGRLEAAKRLGISDVPTIRLAHMTPAQKRAYIIAGNRMSEIAGSWDRKLLALEHEVIKLLDPGFDLSQTGFDLDEIQIMSENLLEGGQDNVPDPNRADPPVSQVGDIWTLGNHRLLCGDALNASSFERLLGEERAQVVITDSPYNGPINGNVAGRGKHREFVMASGEMSRQEFTSFLSKAFGNLVAFSEDGRSTTCLWTGGTWPRWWEATSCYTEFKNLICWNKSSAGLGAFYRSKHELVFVMKNGTAPHINNLGLGGKGRHRSNVWDYDGLGSWTPDRKSELAMHPTVKPVAMIVDALKDCSKRTASCWTALAGQAPPSLQLNRLADAPA